MGVGGGGGYGLTTGTSLTGTCYQQATKIMEPQLWNRRLSLSRDSLLLRRKTAAKVKSQCHSAPPRRLAVVAACGLCAAYIYTVKEDGWGGGRGLTQSRGQYSDAKGG